jgi:hypothetical protein
MSNSLCGYLKNFFQSVIVACVVASAAAAQPAEVLARVFIDCIECDLDYLRQEIAFVNIVRDPALADISAMITTLPTASGGRSYTMELRGTIRTRATSDTVVISVGPNTTETERRQVIARSLKVALLPFIRNTSAAANLDVAYTPPRAAASATRGERDPWHQWVFRVSGSGSFGSDETYSSRGGDGSAAASRVTDAVKIDLSMRGSFNRERYRLDDGSTLVSDRKSWRNNTLAVWSLGNHYSIGFTASAGSSAFENTRFDLRAMPAAEYDLFPYRDATRRQLIIRYGAGIRAAKYLDSTIYDQIEEAHPVHELTAVTDIRQNWGSVWSKAVWSQYLHDTSKRRLTLEGGVDWRIVAGLSLNIGLSYRMIRDQLNIRGANLTNEERLLRLRETQSGYSASGGIGLSYTFGSVFSNIVNSRFRF